MREPRLPRKPSPAKAAKARAVKARKERVARATRKRELIPPARRKIALTIVLSSTLRTRSGMPKRRRIPRTNGGPRNMKDNVTGLKR